ncbi:unnamed protein product [Caenorhabditis bovis]|uniref:Uncharacterized protein n=1 Tax=Caenorhabditis bovis TaxID=2654633 RepID=A0A8S1F1T3_9PELO|nr:unnamed protein product [Caenorhabditis bovis]
MEKIIKSDKVKQEMFNTQFLMAVVLAVTICCFVNVADAQWGYGYPGMGYGGYGMGGYGMGGYGMGGYGMGGYGMRRMMMGPMMGMGMWGKK